MQKSEKKRNANTVGATSSRPHFEEMAKKQNGITLIALIITIIVMMILVGITVSVALNGGLFNTASSAAKTTEKEADKEELQSAIVASYDAVAGTVDGTKLQSNLSGWTVVGSGPYTCTSPKENKFKVTSQGEIGLTALEKYILGEDGTGRKLSEIYDFNNLFLNIPEELETNGGLEIVAQGLQTTIPTFDEEFGVYGITTYDIYFKYDGEIYKFRRCSGWKL